MHGTRAVSRMNPEAETYVMLLNWDLVRPLVPELDPCTSVRLLARGGFINRLAVRAPMKLDGQVAVLPEVMYSFLLQVGVRPSAPATIRELIMSPLFSSSDHLLDLARYEDFFAELIRDAEASTRRTWTRSAIASVTSSLRSSSLRSGLWTAHASWHAHSCG